MNTKENVETKKIQLMRQEKRNSKPKSLRPMHSLVAVRSFKPKTIVAGTIVVKSEDEAKTH